MSETTLENRQMAANRHHAMQTNTQRISHVLASLTIGGRRRSILSPTTPRDGIRVLPDDSQYIPGRR